MSIYNGLNDRQIYVVRVNIRKVGDSSVDTVPMYLDSINYNPYNKPDKHGDPPYYVEDPDDARHFVSLAAAEVIAAKVGGHVLTLAEAKDPT